MATAARQQKARSRRTAAWIAVGLVAVAVIVLVALVLRTPADRAVEIGVVEAPDGTTLGAPGSLLSLAVSPDGRRVAFPASRGDEHRLWIRSLDAPDDARPLDGTDGAALPFWSPDGRRVAFFAAGRLEWVDADGGPPHLVCDAPSPFGGVWCGDDRIVFAPDNAGGLAAVAAAGGAPSPLTSLDAARRETSHRWPFLLDGDRFGYLALSELPVNDGIFVSSFGSDDRVFLVQSSGGAQYAPPGFVVFPLYHTLMVQELSLFGSEVVGDPSALVEDVAADGISGKAGFSVAANGVLVYEGREARARRLAWFDRAGAELSSVAFSGRFFDLALSPDETRAAVQWSDTRTRDNGIRVVDLATGAASRLTARSDDLEDDPVWSPDGTRLAFSARPPGTDSQARVLLQRADGEGGEDELVAPYARGGADDAHPSDWSSDGLLVVYYSGGDIWAIPAFGDRTPTRITATGFDERTARLSPDGRLVAYASNESGAFEVYVRKLAEPSGWLRVSTGGGGQPVWRRDGRELFYVTPDNWLVAVDVADAGAPEVGPPRPLFKTAVESYTAPNRYAVSADGLRFLMNVPALPLKSARITTVRNWQSAVE